MSGFSALQKEVIGVGLCTDCGACAGVCPSKLLTMNLQTEEPEQTRECPPRCQMCYEICPGKYIPMLDLDRVTFGRARELGGDEELLGISQKFVKGYAVDPQTRSAGASGGVIDALLIYALENDIIDAAIIAGMDESQPWRMVPKIATNREQVLAGAETKLVLVPTVSILGQAVDKGYRRLGIVGCPCHIHAIRKMQMVGRPKKILNSIKFLLGLCCGMNFSYRGTQHVVEEITGVPVDQVAKLWYRHGGYPGKFTVVTKDGRTVAISPMEYLLNVFRVRSERCMACYDYANELSDLAVGDYFYDPVKKGAPGISAMVVRTDAGRELMEQAQKANYVTTGPCEKENFFMGTFEYKKHGNAYTISQRSKYGWPVPENQLPVRADPMPRKLSWLHPLFQVGQ